jgi:hypothetical protein
LKILFDALPALENITKVNSPKIDSTLFMVANYNPKRPYNELPLLPPDTDLETKAVLKKLITSSRALSELKGAITNLPNPTLFLDT